jgi:hypothetical protein
MKKNLLLVAAVAVGMSLTSCVKSYTCTCTQTFKSDGHKETTDYPITAKKKDATTACNNLADGDAGTYVESCSLK